ncbi:MAG: hypothetical protein WC385_02160 [Candidatus Paceibacterota bacterium]|jgi:hypothetical protein
MYDRTQLEKAGYEFTPQEERVFNNPSFQFLRERNWPVKWGELTTGLSSKVENFRLISQPSTQQRLLPSQAGKLFDEFAPHLRSLIVLSAVIARDATDPDLILALSSWLNGIDSYYCHPFRWDQFEKDHTFKLRQDARTAEVARLSQGFANVVVLLLGELSPSCRETVREAIMADCLKREVFGEVEAHTSYHSYHFPWPKCQSCEEKESGRRQDCRNPNTVVLVDCGDVPTIIKSVPFGVRRMVKTVRFKVPKSTFEDDTRCAEATLSPSFSVFSLNLLSEEEQQRFQAELEKGLREEQARAIWGGYGGLYSKCQVLTPVGRQKPNALLLAGSPRQESWYRFFKSSDFWQGPKKTVPVDQIGS